MPKPRIILFSGELRNCPCYDTIFNSDFETASVASETDFLASIRQENADAAIVCLCSADLDVFPDVIGPSDSAIVICEAIDPDGDTLVYDWITDARVRIKGSQYFWLYHTSENTRIFYPTNINNVPVDTLWVQCIVRDVKGGATDGLVLFMVKQDLGR